MNPREATHDVDGRRTPLGLEQRLLARARAVGFGPGVSLVVGFSGGRDSLALAAALRWCRDVLGLNSLLVHVDHRLRSESGEEAAVAGQFAEALGLAMRSVAFTTPPAEIHRHVGAEEAARRERYRLLIQVACEVGAPAVATAHHQEDQAETVLLHLMRGSGVHGAAAMNEQSAAPTGQGAGRSDISPECGTPWIWRPFLYETRADITEYAQRLGMEWIEDPSNVELAFRRNIVRREILPIMETHFTGAVAALARYASLAAEDDRTLEHLARAALANHVDPGGRLAVTALGDQPLGIQRRMIRLWMGERTGLSLLTAERSDAVIALARSEIGGKRVEIAEGWTVGLRGGMLHVWH